MFYSRTPVQPDGPQPLDPVQEELERCILFAPPGHLGPFPTYDEVRADRAARGAASARALTLSEAGFGPGVRVVVVHDLDGAVERIERAETAIQQPPKLVKAEGFRPLGEANSDAENANVEIKEITWARKPAFVEKIEAYPDLAARQPLLFPSLVTVALKSSAHSERQRTHKDDVDWWDKKRVQGHKVSRTLSKAEREWIDGAVLRWKVLKGKTEQIVCLTIKSSHLDDLGPVERMEYWNPLVNRVRSYRNSRCTVLGKPHSSWEVRAVGVRESNEDHLSEHCHAAFSFPNREEADLFIAHVQDPANSDVWGDDVQAMRISTRETMVGGKLSSFFNYMLKAAHPQSRFADHTIGWQPSGALVGRRYFITENLTDPDVIERTAAGVARLKEIREEKKRVAFIKKAREKARAAREEGVCSYSYAAPAEPASIEPEIAVEPASIVEPTYPRHSHAGFMSPEADVSVEIEIQRAAPAFTPREPAMTDPAPATVQAGAMELVEDVTPAATPAQPVFVTDPATPVTVLSPAPDAIMEPIPVSSSPKAVLTSLAVFGRSVARSAVAGVGWVASRLGTRFSTPAPSPAAPPARRPRAPLFDASAFISAGAFFGAPDVRPEPW